MSQIRNELRQLCQLQLVDQELAEKSTALQQVESMLGNIQELETARMALAEAQQKLASLKSAHKDIETEMQDLDAKIKKLDGQLYQGGKGSKELTAIQQEIEAQKQRLSALEEKALDLMVQVEAAQAEVDARSKALDTQEKDSAAQQEELKKQQNELKSAVALLQQKRAATAAPISDDTLRLYETVRATRSQAVAKVERGMCKGCRLILPLRLWARVRSGALVQCSSCSRILCLD